jgi:AraC family 4-hydroxyphenylacetate 3-monooxygenase operon regulatory protein
MERARSLLTLTSSPVSEIAYQVGFRSPFYFTRVFKRAAGMSPAAFRKRHGWRKTRSGT